MNLILDIGNSLTKIAAFKNEQLVKHDILKTTDVESVKGFLSNVDEKVRHVLVASVQKEDNELNLFFKNCFATYIQLTSDTKLPIQVDYATPKTLGVDRIAASVGATVHFFQKNVLTIDMGTCITYDFISADLSYKGGGISPGVEMRFKALHNFTAQLPFIEWKNEKPTELIGDSTENSILSGVINGVLSELEGLVSRYESSFDELHVVLTGGSSNLFAKMLKNRIFADPNLVLVGLNRILQYNLEK